MTVGWFPHPNACIIVIHEIKAAISQNGSQIGTTLGQQPEEELTNKQDHAYINKAQFTTEIEECMWWGLHQVSSTSIMDIYIPHIKSIIEKELTLGLTVISPICIHICIYV